MDRDEHDEFCHCRGILGEHAGCCDCLLIAKVRADERAQYQGRRDDMMRALSEELLHVRTKTLADLRAKVEALPSAFADDEPDRLIQCSDVLALLDGDGS
jgi:hypothetical protein